MAFPYTDPQLPLTDRVEDLLARMTLEEKIGQMLQLDARGDLKELVHEKLAGSLLHASPERIVEARELVLQTRLQIPLLMADDCIHGHSFWPGATIFPTQLAMACTWDPDLVRRGARATAVEVASTGLHWTFSPVLCISRDLRWGRVDETFGEDPHLIGVLGKAMIHGYQGDGLTDSTAILATAKHFAGYSETQGGRDASEADISRRKLRSWFLPPFKEAVDAGCRTFMLGYQAIDGVPVTANKWLLNDVLKEEWGFTGTLVTDWDNVGRMVWEQKVCENDVQAAIVAVQAGNDLVMTTPGFFEGAREAVCLGLLDEKLIDQAVRRLLRLKFELGLFENPRIPDSARQNQVIGSVDHAQVNLDMARRALVLLHNDGVLPLDGGQEGTSADAADSLSAAALPTRTIAVIGPNANDQHAQLGDWAGASGQINWLPDGHPRQLTTTVLDGLRDLAPRHWQVITARGADIGELVPDPLGPTFPDGQPRPHHFVSAPVDAQLLESAEQTALGADYVVAVIGDTVALAGETKSTATLDLQGGQIELVERLVATGVPVIVVLIQSKPSVLPQSVLESAAIIEAFNPGMKGGQAIAELILGHIEPTGRLPISFARHAGQLPIHYNQIRGQHGTRYADLTQEPQFDFGFGLSYTTVEYSDLLLQHSVVPSSGKVKATVRLTNTGTRPSVETVQVYLSDLVTSVTWAERELKSFAQVLIQPGESGEVPLEFSADSCTIVDQESRRVVEPGTFELLVGKFAHDPEMLSARFEITP